MCARRWTEGMRSLIFDVSGVPSIASYQKSFATRPFVLREANSNTYTEQTSNCFLDLRSFLGLSALLCACLPAGAVVSALGRKPASAKAMRCSGKNIHVDLQVLLANGSGAGSRADCESAGCGARWRTDSYAQAARPNRCQAHAQTHRHATIDYGARFCIMFAQQEKIPPQSKEAKRHSLSRSQHSSETSTSTTQRGCRVSHTLVSS